MWSTEFDWARRFFDTFADKARATWAHSRQHPVPNVLVTVGGLAAAVVMAWAVQHYGLVERARELVGL